MKQMAPIINDAVDSLINNVERKSNAGESFDIYSMYQGLTMDVIGRTAFGIQTDVQNDPNDPFIRSARVLLSDDIRNVLAIIAASFRELDRLWFYVNRIRFMFKNKGKNPMTELLESVKKVINLRRKNKESRRNDLLQLMLDAKTDETSTVTTDDLTAKDNIDTTENQTTGSSSGKIIRQMTDAEIISNSLLFFLAGYETTSNALAFTTHFLLNYPEIQDKVREEVLQLLKSENELDYYSVNKLQYLDNVLHESLRLYPPVHLFVSRECGEDVQFDKIRLKKGLAVQVPAFILHRDPELWEDPEKFKPERFAPENKEKLNPLAYQPFGAGPRNCVGMRFALMEAKLALARLLSKYKLKRCAETESEPIPLMIRRNSIKPGKGVYLKAVPF
ncbi:cytochrome P450 3A19-like [Stegodyphus dumicola]|uniref:cytochrome P450 3A19-like n=1 Tax=Stegodyphus dumicola TaxID=202533 RepID=UPI0015B01BFD|nr:cytochrome P450 3A19-like [Stegodyphus dumicola]